MTRLLQFPFQLRHLRSEFCTQLRVSGLLQLLLFHCKLCAEQERVRNLFAFDFSEALLHGCKQLVKIVDMLDDPCFAFRCTRLYPKRFAQPAALQSQAP